MLHTLPVFKFKNVSASKNFPWSINKNKKYSYKLGDCPVTESMNKESYMGLNMWKYDYTNSDIKYIIEMFKEVWEMFGLNHNLNKQIRLK